MPDTPLLLLFTFFSNARFFIFYSLNIFIVWKGVLVPTFFFQPSSLLIPPPPFLKKLAPPFLTTIKGKYYDSMMIYWNQGD